MSNSVRGPGRSGLRDPTDRSRSSPPPAGPSTAWLREHAHRRHRARGRHVHRRDPLLLRRQGRGADRRAQVGERTSLRQARRALLEPQANASDSRRSSRWRCPSPDRAGASTCSGSSCGACAARPSCCPSCESSRSAGAAISTSPVRRGAESGEFSPGRARRGRRAPDRARRRARIPVAARLLVDLAGIACASASTHSSPEQLGIRREALARDAHAAVAAVEARLVSVSAATRSVAAPTSWSARWKRSARAPSSACRAHALAIWEGLRASPIATFGMRTELSSGFAADGYARERAAGAALLSTGPGALNSLTALMESASAHVPVVAISSQIPRDLIGRGRGFLHDLPDQLASFEPIVKQACRAESADGLAEWSRTRGRWRSRPPPARSTSRCRSTCSTDPRARRPRLASIPSRRPADRRP